MNLWRPLAAAVIAWSAVAARGAEPPSSTPARGPGEKGPAAAVPAADAAAAWADQSMRAKAACAEAVVVGRIAEVLPPRRVSAKVDDGPARAADWTPIRVSVERVLSARTPPPSVPPATPAAAAAAVRPGLLDLLAASDVPVAKPGAGKPPSATRAAAAPDAAPPPLPPLAAGVPYVMFLDRVPEEKGLVLLDRSACVPADDRSVAEAAAAGRLDAWPWGPAAGPLRACFLPAGPPRVSWFGGDRVGASVDASGWVVVRNVGPTAVEVVFGKEDPTAARSSSAMLEAVPADGAKTASPIGRGRRVRLAAGGLAFVHGPPNARCPPAEAYLTGIGGGALMTRVKVRVTTVNGRPPPVGQDALVTPVVAEDIPSGPFPPEPVARRPAAARVVFVCHIVGSGDAATVRTALAKAIGELKPAQSFNVVACAADGRPVKLSDKGLVPATPEGVRSADAFLAKLAAAKSSDPVAMLQAGLAEEANLLYFLTTATIPEGKLAPAVARLNAGGKTKINTILFGNFDKGTEAELEKVATDNRGAYQFTRPEDVDP